MFGDPVENEKGWEMIPLSELGTCKNGMNFASDEDGIEIAYLGVGDFKDNSRIDGVSGLSQISLNTMPSEEYLLKDEDIVFVRSNGSKELVGRCLAVYPGNEKLTFSGFCIRWRKNSDKVMTDFLLQVLKTENVRILMRGRGANIQNLNQQILGKLMIPVPNMALQQSFVEFVGAIDKSRFIEMFGDPVSNPKGWDKYPIKDCLIRIENGKSFVCSNQEREGGSPAILKLSAATYGEYLPEENKALLDDDLFNSEVEVREGDLLFTRKNTPDLVGMAAYVYKTPPKLMMPDLIFRLVPNERINPIFLWQLINCREFRPIIRRAASGSAQSMSNISKERLGKIQIICPPISEQERLLPLMKQIDKSKLAIYKIKKHVLGRRLAT